MVCLDMVRVLFLVELVFSSSCSSLAPPLPSPSPPPIPSDTLTPPPPPFACFFFVTALPFGEGQHFVQLAGGTNDRTAEKLREVGLIGGDGGPGRLLVEVSRIFFCHPLVCWYKHARRDRVLLAAALVICMPYERHADDEAHNLLVLWVCLLNSEVLQMWQLVPFRLVLGVCCVCSPRANGVLPMLASWSDLQQGKPRIVSC